MALLLTVVVVVTFVTAAVVVVGSAAVVVVITVVVVSVVVVITAATAEGTTATLRARVVVEISLTTLEISSSSDGVDVAAGGLRSVVVEVSGSMLWLLLWDRIRVDDVDADRFFMQAAAVGIEELVREGHHVFRRHVFGVFAHCLLQIRWQLPDANLFDDLIERNVVVALFKLCKILRRSSSVHFYRFQYGRRFLTLRLAVTFAKIIAKGGPIFGGGIAEQKLIHRWILVHGEFGLNKSELLEWG